ncbi:hypothetical protein E4U22_004666 [Claviceps purpurea]|nr:hypothetical protein E4U22_004666 [Claviceps purpurea]
MSNEAGPSKRRRMLPTTELEDTASEGSARQCSKCSYILQISHFASARRPSVLIKTCERCQNYGRQVPRQRQNRGSSPDNIRGPSEHNRLANETPSQQERSRRLDRDDRASRTVRRNRGEAVSTAPRPVSFVCYECRIPRPFPGARSTRDGICYYCTLSSTAPLGGQVK